MLGISAALERMLWRLEESCFLNSEEIERRLRRERKSKEVSLISGTIFNEIYLSKERSFITSETKSGLSLRTKCIILAMYVLSFRLSF